MLFSALCSFLYFFVLVKSYRKKKKRPNNLIYVTTHTLPSSSNSIKSTFLSQKKFTVKRYKSGYQFCCHLANHLREVSNHEDSKGHGSHQSHYSSKINGNGTLGSQVHESQYTATTNTQKSTGCHGKAANHQYLPHPANNHTINKSNTSCKPRTIEIC